MWASESAGCYFAHLQEVFWDKWGKALILSLLGVAGWNSSRSLSRKFQPVASIYSRLLRASRYKFLG